MRIAVTLLLLWIAAPASAQSLADDGYDEGHARGSVLDPAEGCRYDACALRLWEGNVLEGRAQEPIGGFGFIRPPQMGELLAPSDSAAAHFRTVEKTYTMGRVTTITARLFSLVGIVMAFSADSGVQGWGIGLQAVAVPVGWLGQRRVTRAEEAMSRAVWWYNRDVTMRGAVSSPSVSSP